MSPRNKSQPPRDRALLVRRLDQAVIAALTLSALVACGVYWLAQGGARGRLIPIERAPTNVVHFNVDINQADWPELTVLPGIGEALARRIVESRAADGPYADLDELQRVRGIGPKTLERIRPFLRPVPGTGNVAGP